MMSPPRLALAACLLPLATVAVHATDAGRETAVVPKAGTGASFDMYEALSRFRIRHKRTASALESTTAGLLRQLLKEPASPYSDLVDHPPMTNHLAWRRFTTDLSSTFPDAGEVALDTLRWQMGLTKARPGVDIAVDEPAITRYRGREAAANARKAEIDSDIFWKARDMNGSRLAEAAGEAVALQMLRDQVRHTDPKDHRALDIQPGVLARYMAQTHPEAISGADRRYLAEMLGIALAARHSPVEGGGSGQLPTIYRVARTAAAYADANGYLTPGGYCDGDAPRIRAPDSPFFDEPSALCFVAATDRAVARWYRRQSHVEAVRHPPPPEHGGFYNLLHWVGAVFVLVDFAAFIEVTEALTAEDMVLEGVLEDADAELASSRSSRLTCRISQ
ncbi:hypothetical protein [Luteibacter yeojuensis]|uniref:Uncharacterized protein n=1 Tax=Luteibacter yeojuensis TaxID=345309 RepID=A0A7X5QVF5_9GAMM|nr:hypothetical protein [Luteibacter yeojuensis]NID16150.1 hypothetical protein [Luteibacter yeojuensis]